MSTRLLPRFRQATSLKFLLVLMVAAIMLIVVSEKVFAQHTVTPGASVDVDADANGGAFTALNDIVFTDEPGVDLAATNTFALTAPAGFEFNPAAAGDTATGSGYGTTQIDLGGAAGAAVAPVYSVGNTVATWTVTTAGAGTAGIITITGMELRPTAGKTAIAGDGTANVTIAGNVTTFNTANAHPIDHVPGVPANLLVETLDNNLTNGTGTPTATQTAGVAFATRVSSRDQHNNVNNDGANIVDGGTVDLAFVTNAGNAPDGTAPIVAVGSGAIAFTNGVVEQNGFILTNAAAAQTITATVQNAGGGNLAAPANGVTGVDAGDTVQSAVPANFLVETLDNKPDQRHRRPDRHPDRGGGLRHADHESRRARKREQQRRQHRHRRHGGPGLRDQRRQLAQRHRPHRRRPQRRHCLHQRGRRAERLHFAERRGGPDDHGHGAERRGRQPGRPG